QLHHGLDVVAGGQRGGGLPDQQVPVILVVVRSQRAAGRQHGAVGGRIGIVGTDLEGRLGTDRELADRCGAVSGGAGVVEEDAAVRRQAVGRPGGVGGAVLVRRQRIHLLPCADGEAATLHHVDAGVQVRD